MAQAVAGKELARPYMGVRYAAITRQFADDQKLPVNDGALVGGADANGDRGRRARHARPRRPGSRTATSSSRSTTRRSTRDHPLDATLSQFAPGDDRVRSTRPARRPDASRVA